MHHVLQHEIDILIAAFIRQHPHTEGDHDWASIGASFVRAAVCTLCKLPRHLKGDALMLAFVRDLLARIRIEP